MSNNTWSTKATFGAVLFGLAACTSPEEIAAEYRQYDCRSLDREQAVILSQRDDAEVDFVVTTTAALITGDDDIELDSDIAEWDLDELEERLAILSQVRSEKGCI